MKKFTSVFEMQVWCLKVLRAGVKGGIAPIMEQLYKRSQPFTYYDTGQTYGDRGNPTLDFKNGLIIQRSPQARRLYYRGGTPNSRHPMGRPRWWEHTKKMYAGELKDIAKKQLEEAKLKS